jgi:hypothetical protein
VVAVVVPHSRLNGKKAMKARKVETLTITKAVDTGRMESRKECHRASATAAAKATVKAKGRGGGGTGGVRGGWVGGGSGRVALGSVCGGTVPYGEGHLNPVAVGVSAAAGRETGG